jgi:sensor histidine kinase YesM
MRRKLWSEVRDMSLLVMLGFAMTWFGLSCSDCREDMKRLLVMGTFTAVLWILLWKGNEYLGSYISTKVSWVRYPLRRFLIGIVSTIAYTFGVMYALTAIYEQAFVINIGAGVIVSVIITIVISLFMHGREFLMNWRKAAIEAEQYQKESTMAQYQNLKNQVNPHFLFNSLNALSNLIYDDEQKALVFIDQLQEVYKYVIEKKDKETVPVSEELRFLNSYLYLQQIRFGDKLRLNVPDELHNAFIPPLSLQMLIENAIKHNVISEEDPLSIEICFEDSHLVVRNNLQLKQSVGEESAGVGLENIRRRYQMLIDRDIEIMKTDTHFTVKLPLITDKQV